MKTLCDVCTKANSTCQAFPMVTDSCCEFETTGEHANHAIRFIAQGFRSDEDFYGRKRRVLLIVRTIMLS